MNETLYSNSSLVLAGSAWSEKPIKLSQCHKAFEVKQMADWQVLPAFLKEYRGKHIAFVLNYQLKSLLDAFDYVKHPHVDFPLALFLVFDKVEPHRELVSCFDDQIFTLQSRITIEAYLEAIRNIQEKIQAGAFYETNFCVEYFAKVELNPDWLFQRMIKLSEAPFSAHLQAGKHHIISGSPELFFKTKSNHIVSSPIKGTRPRSSNAVLDAAFHDALQASEKDKAENTMIVDLVRHDLSRIAEKNSVRVDAFCKPMRFKTVHQLESSISAQLRPGMDFKSIVEALFPMGSMTGAPKMAAVKHCDNAEPTARTVYSGSLGWIKPDGDITSSVLIRGFYYDALAAYLSTAVGGAITIKSKAEEEYQECMTKLQLMQEALIDSAIKEV